MWWRPYIKIAIDETNLMYRKKNGLKKTVRKLREHIDLTKNKMKVWDHMQQMLDSDWK